MMNSFFDLWEIELTPYIDMLWNSSKKNISLYIRGSSLLPITSETSKPIDVDLLLFTHDDIGKIKPVAYDISNRSHKDFPSIPHLDIKIINSLSETTELLFNILLIEETGRLLCGEKMCLSKSRAVEMYYDIVLFAISEAESKLKSVIHTSDMETQSKRIPHLSKSILRIAGLLELKSGVYTRSPQKSADYLCTKYPKLKNNLNIIIDSFNYPFFTKELKISYSLVLNEIKERVKLV